MPAATARGDVLLERDDELERIDGCLARCRDGRGGAVWVEAPAGMGKSALLAAAAERARASGVRVLAARSGELEREFGFGVVRQLFEPALAEASESERATLLEGPPGVAVRLLAGEVGAPDPTFAVLHGLYWLAANLAADRPTLLVVDDFQWADAPSLRFFAFLFPRLDELPLAVMVAGRPVEPGPTRDLLTALAHDRATDLLRLRPLTTAAVARVLARVLATPVEEAFASACREATRGNPLLVRALAAALQDQGIAPLASEAGRVQHVGTTTLARWIQLQVRRLGNDAALLSAAVAILERTELPYAARLVGLDDDAAALAADVLIRAGVLEGRPLTFVHPILRTSAYSTISATRRLEAHRKAARMLADAGENEARVAEHLLASDPAGDGWVVERLTAAARQAAVGGAPESAATYLRRALAEPPPPGDAGGLLLQLGTAELAAGDHRWAERLEASVAAAGDDAGRLAAALVLATALVFHGRYGDAVAVTDRVAARVETDDARLALEGMAVASGMIDAGTAPSVSGRARALRAAAGEPSAPRSVVAVAAYLSALANDPAAQAADLARRAVNADPPHADAAEPPWFLHATVTLFWCEQHAEALALLDAAAAEARTEANALVLPALLSQRAWLALRESDLSAAEADARAVLDAPAPPLYRLLSTGVLVGALVERGDLDAAEDALAPLGDVGASQTGGVLLHARGLLRLAQHRATEALDDLLAAGRIALGTDAPSPAYLPWRSAAALASLALGDRSGAQRRCDEEVDLARAFGAPRALGVALRAAGVIAGGRRGEALLRESAEVLAPTGARLEHAHALTDLGAQLRRSNRRAEARELLRPALDAAHRAGARPLADRAETELRATGAKPRRVELTGLEALTASERRIAELAAQGLTNREIAQTLFVTARTVEGHLTNVFRKLDVRAREQLADALA